MSEPGRHTTTPRLALALALGIAASAAALTWLGFRAVGSWRQSASSEAERRNRQAVDLLARALTRDMRGAHGRVLASPQWDEFMLETPQDMVRIVASAFARYPYPESFFAWRAAAKRPSPAGPMTFFTRSDRPPRWLPVDGNRGRFPVTVVDVAPPAAAVLDRIRSDARLGRRFAAAALRGWAAASPPRRWGWGWASPCARRGRARGSPTCAPSSSPPSPTSSRRRWPRSAPSATRWWRGGSPSRPRATSTPSSSSRRPSVSPG